MRRRERARSKRERADPDCALALWEGLVAGRWSLVDHFESDGKRFVVAHKNDPDRLIRAGSRAASARSPSTSGWAAPRRRSPTCSASLATAVSNATHRAVAKLGLGGRAELASFFTPGGPRARLAEFELAGEHLLVGAAPLLDESALERLSAAERDVALDLLRGATVPEIARRRASSPLTVETQVKSVYEKLGVGSRHGSPARLGGSLIAAYVYPRGREEPGMDGARTRV